MPSDCTGAMTDLCKEIRIQAESMDAEGYAVTAAHLWAAIKVIEAAENFSAKEGAITLGALNNYADMREALDELRGLTGG